MIIRKIVSCILAMMIITIGCACSAQNQGKSNNNTERSVNKSDVTTNGSTGNNNKQTVTIQYFKDEVDIDKAISIFQYNNPKVIIDSEIIERDNKTTDAFSNKLLLDLNTGEGPDIMIFDNYLFNSLTKAASSGVFYDLNKLVKTDSDMDPSNFYENVYNFGVINGSRYFAPLRAEFSYFYTTNSILKKNNLSIDYKKWTWKDMLRIAEGFSRDKKKSAKYLFSLPIAFTDIVNSFGKSFIDYKNGKSNFNNDELKEALRILKKINSYAPEGIQGNALSDLTSGLKSNTFVLHSFGYISNGQSLLGFNSKFMDDLGDEMLLVPYPSWYGDGRVNSLPKLLFCINSKCRNMEYAYKFMKYLLSEDTQSLKNYSAYKLNYSKGYPMRRAALASDLAIMASGGTYEKSEKPFSNAFISNYKSMVENGKANMDYDQRIQDLIFKAGDSYMSGKMSEEEALKKIDKEVELFLNE